MRNFLNIISITIFNTTHNTSLTMTSVTDQESEIKSWLKIILKDEDVDNFSVKVVGGSEKGDGYVGDIVFVSLTPTNGLEGKSYNLVLKCSKRSKALRETAPVRSAFLNEMYIYDTVLPAFSQFQTDRGIVEPFNSVPKCYGTLETEDMEIIVFENLKELGYDLWDKRRPLTREHVDMVIGEYAKFHAISIAMKDQNPERFEELSRGLTNVLAECVDLSNEVYGNSIEDVYDLLKDDVDEYIILKYRKLKDKMDYIFRGIFEEMKGVQVILHGDCWSNNFLFKHAKDNKEHPLYVAILDWQISRCSTPILDLSYFLFTSISKEDISDLDIILQSYYDSLKIYVKKLGSSLDLIYPVEQFFEDWRKYSIYGITMGSIVYKICATAKDEVLDIGEVADKGGHVTKSFEYEVKDKTCFKDRSRHIVEYVVANHLI